MQIPLEGRIAAVANVFDALRIATPTGNGPERGRHFDPEVLNTFLKSMSEIQVLRQKCAD